MTEPDYSIMLRYLDIEKPELTFFFLVNLTCVMLIAASCLIMFLRNNFLLGRLYFSFTLILCVFFQVPLTLFSHQIERALYDPWKFSLCVNGAAFVLLFWGKLGSQLTIRADSCSYPENVRSMYILTGVVGMTLVAVYLYHVPWDCTGLFAIIHDPWMTLIAREFSIKLIGSSISTYSIGANANAVAPIFILLSFWLFLLSVRRRQLLSVLTGLLGGFVAVVSVILTGTKGLLFPSMLMLVVGSYFWSKAWLERILTVGFSVIFIAGSILTFELIKDRGAEAGGYYDFASCSARLGTCPQSRTLLNSLKSRNYSLGLPKYLVTKLEERLDCLCNAEVEKQLCPVATVESSSGYNSDTPADISLPERKVVQHIEGILYRLFVTPFQVTAWHFMYAETEKPDGVLTLPFANRFFGSSLNTPELVYQKYASEYFGGDKTSTGTSPTGFLLSYTAYAGWLGFLLSIVLIIGLDIFVASLSKFLDNSLTPILIGLVSIMSTNFMVSDFVTVMISHGGAAGVFMLIVFALLKKKNA